MVGTVAVETSEFISKKLVAAGVPHEVLNAKNHYKEAQIIMNAGQRGAVTIALTWPVVVPTSSLVKGS